MKSTGIIRRIDELGRIVIPKEIRKTLRLSEGTQMEIYTSEDSALILKKYSTVEEIKNYAESFCNSLADTTQKSVLITDTDFVIACNNISKKNYINKQISSELDKIINERKSYLLNVVENSNTYQIIVNDKNSYNSQIIVPIVANSDVVGSIIMVSQEQTDSFTATDVKVIQTVANLLASILEQ